MPKFSIGGSISLIVAARRNPRVARVIAINPYDYAKGRGMARSSPLGWVVNYVALVPFIGETVMRLINFLIMRSVLNGGVADPTSILRPSCRRCIAWGIAEATIARLSASSANRQSWETAAKDYGRIEIPVLLIWGAQDWARPSEREHDRKLIPGVELTTFDRGGHFLALDRPQELTQAIVRFAAQARAA